MLLTFFPILKVQQQNHNNDQSLIPIFKEKWFMAKQVQAKMLSATMTHMDKDHTMTAEAHLIMTIRGALELMRLVFRKMNFKSSFPSLG